MRIGLITSSYPLSRTDTVNAGVFAYDLARALSRRGHQVWVVTPQKNGQTELSDDIPVHFIRWPGSEKDLASISMRNPVNLARFLFLVLSGLIDTPRLARQHRWDVCLALWAIPSGFFALSALLFAGVPFGVWALGSDIWARKKYPFGESIVKKVLKSASFRLADGAALAREAAQISGLDCEFTPSARKIVAPEIENVHLDQDIPSFLFIGRYELNKGPDILVEAMRRFLDSGGKAHLHLFGGGSLSDSLQAAVKGYESYIHLNGYAPPATAAAYLQSCDWLVIPSRIESIPLIFVDAINYQIPVISTRVGDLGELIDTNQVGITIPPQNSGALQQALEMAAVLPRSAYLGKWDDLARIFDLERSASVAEDYLRKALE